MTYLWKRKIKKMNKYISVIAALLVLSVSGFAKTSMTKAKTISYMSMERTACFGRCPMYKVEIYNTGLVRYTGRQFVDYTGVYEYNIGAAKAKALLKQYADKRVDTCSQFYDSNIADLPGIMYNFKINGKDKEISNAHFGPKFLDNLAIEVDKNVKPDKNWKKVKDINTNE